MPIKVSCKDCGESFQVKDELAGRRVKCRVCSVPVRVPDEVDPEASSDELPVSKHKARLSRGKKSSVDPAAMTTLMIRVGIGVAAALVIGVAIWAINGKMASNAQIAAKNEEINKQNAANAAEDAQGMTPMPGMGPAGAMPGMATPGMATPGMVPTAGATPPMAGTATPPMGAATVTAGMPPVSSVPATAPVNPMVPATPTTN